MSAFWNEEERERCAVLFKDLFAKNIRRDGAGFLLEALESTDFFTAPAGEKHHGAYRGGLLRHSLNVYYELLKDKSIAEIDRESVAICGLLHDVCKEGVYHPAGGGKYVFRDPFPLGHGEKSVFLLSRFIRLTEEEALAIRWHTGAWDDAVRGGSRSLDAAMDFSPLVYSLHAADMRATLKEKREEARNGNTD